MKRLPLWLALITTAFACSPDPPGIVGKWKNRTNQLLDINADLKGVVYQERRCVAPLSIYIHRDPYDRYAIRFIENQSIFFPLAQLELFAPSEYFCSSKDSVAMCRFCRVDGNTMECGTTEQKITGKGSFVTHDCHWERVVGTITSTVPDGGMACPAEADAGGGGCRAGVPIFADAATSSTSRDAGVGD